MHCQLGNNSLNLTSSIFGMKSSTVATWVSKKVYITTWINLVPDLSFKEVINSIHSDWPYFKKYNNMIKNICYM